MKFVCSCVKLVQGSMGTTRLAKDNSRSSSGLIFVLPQLCEVDSILYIAPRCECMMPWCTPALHPVSPGWINECLWCNTTEKKTHLRKSFIKSNMFEFFFISALKIFYWPWYNLRYTDGINQRDLDSKWNGYVNWVCLITQHKAPVLLFNLIKYMLRLIKVLAFDI